MAIGIVCEYNPFHNGHKYQIDKIREKYGDEPIICAMSGNITERGEIALFDKYERAKSAILCGADLVLEIPMPMSFSSAEFFADGAIKTLANAGASTLVFGYECKDFSKIIDASKIVITEEFINEYKKRAKIGGSTSVYFDLLCEFMGEKVEFSSNDILGIEYIKAIIKNGYNFEIDPIKREGSSYLDKTLKANVNPSASAIRIKIRDESLNKIKHFVPYESFKVLKEANFAFEENISSAILYTLRTFDISRVENENIAISDIGLVNRIISCAKASSNIREFYELVATKKYTNSAIRRAVLYMLLGITYSDLRLKPKYTNLLATNSVGRRLLSRARGNDTDFHIITKPSDVSQFEDTEIKREVAIQEKADALFSLAEKIPEGSTELYRRMPYIL